MKHTHLVFDIDLTPIVSQKSNRIEPLKYDRQMYKKHDVVERLFRRHIVFRQIYWRFEKLDGVFAFFIHFALIIDALNSVNTP